LCQPFRRTWIHHHPLFAHVPKDRWLPLYAIENLDVTAIFQTKLRSSHECFRPRASGWLWLKLGAPLAIFPNWAPLNRHVVALFRPARPDGRAPPLNNGAGAPFRLAPPNDRAPPPDDGAVAFFHRALSDHCAPSSVRLR
jgi:hypothetical protein